MISVNRKRKTAGTYKLNITRVKMVGKVQNLF